MRGACTGGDLTAENIHTESQGALLRCILKMQVSTALYVHLPVEARVCLIQTESDSPLVFLSSRVYCSYSQNCLSLYNVLMKVLS